MILPKHVAEKAQSDRMGRAKAAMMAEPVRNMLTSDEFASRRVVQEQIDKLREHVEFMRKADSGYTLPRPSGWKMSLLMLTHPDQTDGGLLTSDQEKISRAISSPQGIVLAMGPACYQDPARFEMPSGEIEPWVSVGDRVVWTKYDAGIFRLANEQIIGFMTDTQPVATLDGGWDVRF